MDYTDWTVDDVANVRNERFEAWMRERRRAQEYVPEGNSQPDTDDTSPMRVFNHTERAGNPCGAESMFATWLWHAHGVTVEQYQEWRTDHRKGVMLEWQKRLTLRGQTTDRDAQGWRRFWAWFGLALMILLAGLVWHSEVYVRPIARTLQVSP